MPLIDRARLLEETHALLQAGLLLRAVAYARGAGWAGYEDALEVAENTLEAVADAYERADQAP